MYARQGFTAMVLLMASVSVKQSAGFQAVETVPLWKSGAPGSAHRADESETVRVTDDGERVVSNIHQPSIAVYLPDANSSAGVAVIIAPGGGHRELWSDHEGHNVAKYLQDRGIVGVVLKYRLANERDSPYDVDRHSVADMQRAIRLVRSRADEWDIDADRVGVMGFSAGGEVAALASMRFDDGDDSAEDAVQRESSKPAFQALIYPGRSNRYAPSEGAPPAFIVCGYGDRPDISRGMAELYLKFKDVRVPAELHVYSEAEHGFGLRQRNRGAVGKWADRFVEWLEDRDLAARPGADEHP